MTHSYRFPTIQGVISHLHNDHNMEIGNQTHSFENFTKFNEWKVQEDKTSKSCTYRIHQLNCTVVIFSSYLSLLYSTTTTTRV